MALTARGRFCYAVFSMNNDVIDEVFDILRREVAAWKEPIVGVIARERDPFKVLIATLLSLRTRDDTTAAASARLFRLADTPAAMAGLEAAAIAQAIYPVGFYKTKAANIVRIAAILRDDFDGRVPDDLETLLGLPGVGRKTANLVITLGFGGDGICVDTHVHRITNRWGYVATRTPLETEMRLREILPKTYWKEINDFLVAYGQNLCTPLRPLCSRCELRPLCARTGVAKSR